MSSSLCFENEFKRVLRYMNGIDASLKNGDITDVMKKMIAIKMVPMSHKLLESTRLEHFLRRVRGVLPPKQATFVNRILEGLRPTFVGPHIHLCLSHDDSYDCNETDNFNDYVARNQNQNQIPQQICESRLANIEQSKDEIKKCISNLDLHKLHVQILNLEKIPVCVYLLTRSGIKDFIAELIINTVGVLAQISYRIWSHYQAVFVDSNEQTIIRIKQNSSCDFKQCHFYIDMYLRQINHFIANYDEAKVVEYLLMLREVPITVDLIIKSQIKVCLYNVVSQAMGKASEIAYGVIQSLFAMEREYFIDTDLEKSVKESEVVPESDRYSNCLDCDVCAKTPRRASQCETRLHLITSEDGMLLGLIVEDKTNKERYEGETSVHFEPQECLSEREAGTSFNQEFNSFGNSRSHVKTLCSSLKSSRTGGYIGGLNHFQCTDSSISDIGKCENNGQELQLLIDVLDMKYDSHKDNEEQTSKPFDEED